jgi:hypothetical protein
MVVHVAFVTASVREDRAMTREEIVESHARSMAQMIGGPEEGWGIYADWLRSFLYRVGTVPKIGALVPDRSAP